MKFEIKNSNILEYLFTFYFRTCKRRETRGQWPYRPVATRAMRVMATSKQPQWPQRSNVTSDLMQATSITLASMCILPGTAIMVTSEIIVASKWPLRSLLTSNSNSVSSITHVPVLIYPLNGCMGQIFRKKEAKYHPLTCSLRRR